MGHAPQVDAEPNDWDLGNAVRKKEKQFAMDLQLLMTETTNDPSLHKTLVCLERQQHDNMPDEYSLYIKSYQPDMGWFPMINSNEELEDNRHQPPTQGTFSHKQKVNGGKKLLVATDHRSHTEEMRELRPVQNVR